MEILVILGLLTEEQLERYLKTIGELDEDESLDTGKDKDNGKGKDKNVKVDPLLSLGVGDDKSILDVELLGEDGLLDIDLLDNNLLNLGGDGPLLNLGGKDEGLLGLGGILKKRGDGLGRIADIDALGPQDKGKPAPIDVDALTYAVPLGRRQNKGLLDIQVGGEKEEDQAAIDLDLLTRPKDKTKGGKGSDSGNGDDDNDDPHYLSIYQPVCKKAFKKGDRDHAHKCHAQDANHCLALCHSKGALLTLEADAEVGDIANIHVCAAVEFNNKSQGDNCHYFVAPEHEPCHDEQLEDNDDCYIFVRN